ncbi:MAG: hypothetical protein ABIR91_04080 [Candidatus Saccharimonadales bacterium]
MNNETDSPKISIYIPTHPKSTSQTMNEDRIRLKNALQSIDSDPRISGADMQPVLHQLRALDSNADFWQHQAASVAIFADTGGYQVVHLPHEVTPYAGVSNHFIVSPLLALAGLGSSYYILDVNLDAPKLYSGNEYGLSEITSDVLPGGIEDVLDIEQRKKSLDFRSGDSAGNNMFYGHGSVDDERTNDTDKYLRILADAVDKFLADKSDPLLIAGTASRVAQLRPLLSYAHCIDTELSVNRDATSEPELHAVSRRAIADRSTAVRGRVLETLRAASPEQKVDGIAAVRTAAERGKIETLFLPILRMTSDSVDQSSGPRMLMELPNDIEAFELAVRAATHQGGAIVAVEQSEFADDPSMKALLRF